MAPAPMLKSTSLQSPLGAPTHLSLVSCIKPCSPAPPTVLGLHELSCMAKDARRIAGIPYRLPYFSNVEMKSLQFANAESARYATADRSTVTILSILIKGGFHPLSLMPQVRKSIWPLGPLNAVISLVAPLDPQLLEEMTLTTPSTGPPPESLLVGPLSDVGG